MHKSELKVNLTLITQANKVDEFRTGTTGTHKIIGSLKIQFWIWFNIPLQRINWTSISYVNNNETLCAQVHDLLSTTFNLPMNWCP